MNIQAIQNYNVKNYSGLQSLPNNKTINKNVSRPQGMALSDISSVYFRGMAPVKTSFETEIEAQPKVLRNLIDGFFEEDNTITGIDLNLTKEDLDKARAINIVASGSSKNAGEMAKSFMEKATNIPVNILCASEIITNPPKLNKNDIMIFVSQSGNTADTYDALAYSKEKGLKTIAVTNKPGSRIHEDADSAMYIQAGQENAVAATKSVTTSIVSLWGLGMKMGEIKGTFSPNSENTYVQQLKALPDKVESIINDKKDVNAIAKKVAKNENFYFLAKDPNIGAVSEGALKLTETTAKRVLSASSSEFMHGMFSSIKPDDVFLEIVTGDTKASDLAKENYGEIVAKRKPRTSVMIKNYDDKKVENDYPNANFINVPTTAEEFYPLLNTVRFQQLTNAITKELKIDPDNGGGFLTKYRGSLTLEESK
ncbi:SIS domain-containing protein [bacterium]|nr:SIS domain-containing protein [bacterium]